MNATLDKLGAYSKTTNSLTLLRPSAGALSAAAKARRQESAAAKALRLRSEVNSELNFPSNFEGLVLGCIDADFCK